MEMTQTPGFGLRQGDQLLMSPPFRLKLRNQGVAAKLGLGIRTGANQFIPATGPIHSGLGWVTRTSAGWANSALNSDASLGHHERPSVTTKSLRCIPQCIPEPQNAYLFGVFCLF